MNKKNTLRWLTAGLLAFMSLSSSAGTVSLMQPTNVVIPGTNVTLGLSLDFGVSEAVSSGAVDISFDPNQLSFLGFTYGTDYTLNTAFNLVTTPSIDSLIPGNQFFSVRFQAADTFTGLSGSGDIGQLLFGTSGLTGTTLVSFSDSVQLGGLFDTYGYELAPFAGSASISAVPVPAAVWLMASGLLGLVGLGRRS